MCKTGGKCGKQYITVLTVILWRVRRRKLRNAQQNDEELNLESYFLRYSTEPNGGWSGNLPLGGGEWQILHHWVKNGQLWC